MLDPNEMKSFDKEHQEQLDLLWTMIKKVKVGIVTLFHNERWFSAPMYLIQDNFDNGRLYFIANDSCTMIQEMKEHHAVLGVIFSNPTQKIYVSLCGAALITDDQSLIDRFWDNKLLRWLPKGKEDPSLRLIVVDAHSAEYWDEDNNRLQAAFDRFITGTTLEGVRINEHQHLNLN